MRRSTNDTSAKFLTDVNVLELGGRGPVPFAGALLADHGATVIRIDRPLEPDQAAADFERPRHPLRRGKTTLTVDLTSQEGHDFVTALLPRTNIVLEGFRPGKAASLGLGAHECWSVNRDLVYGSMSGWGVDGPCAHLAGHDINYLAASGILGQIGSEQGGPVPPMNLVGDYGAGALLGFGVIAALHAGRQGQQGAHVRTSIFESALYFASRTHMMVEQGTWRDGLALNDLQGEAPYYGVYRTADDRYLAAGPIEQRFYRRFVDMIGLDAETLPPRTPDNWPSLRKTFAEVIAKRSIEDWLELFADSDCCVTPVLTADESARHPQTRAVLGGRSAFEAVPTLTGEPAPTRPATAATAERTLIAEVAGLDQEAIDALTRSGVITIGDGN